jgi:hypothetical protein
MSHDRFDPTCGGGTACARFAACAAIALVMGACGSVQPQPLPDRNPFVEDHSSAVVIRFQGVVPVPFETAYMNLLRQAQTCWGRTAIDDKSPARWEIRDDADLVARTASIILVSPAIGHGTAAASIRLRETPGGTHVNASALRSTPGAPHMGSEQIHLLQRWTLGERTACDTP